LPIIEAAALDEPLRILRSFIYSGSGWLSNSLLMYSYSDIGVLSCLCLGKRVHRLRSLVLHVRQDVGVD
jgi:hypothetical protein